MEQEHIRLTADTHDIIVDVKGNKFTFSASPEGTNKGFRGQLTEGTICAELKQDSNRCKITYDIIVGVAGEGEGTMEDSGSKVKRSIVVELQKLDTKGENPLKTNVKAIQGELQGVRTATEESFNDTERKIAKEHHQSELPERLAQEELKRELQRSKDLMCKAKCLSVVPLLLMVVLGLMLQSHTGKSVSVAKEELEYQLHRAREELYDYRVEASAAVSKLQSELQNLNRLFNGLDSSFKANEAALNSTRTQLSESQRQRDQGEELKEALSNQLNSHKGQVEVLSDKVSRLGKELEGLREKVGSAALRTDLEERRQEYFQHFLLSPGGFTNITIESETTNDSDFPAAEDQLASLQSEVNLIKGELKSIRPEEPPMTAQERTLLLQTIEKYERKLSMNLELDTTSEYFESLAIQGSRLTVSPGFDGWFPAFLNRLPMKTQQFFEIEITLAGNNGVMVGINVQGNRDRQSTFRNQGSMYLCAHGNPHYWINGQGMSKQLQFMANDGDRVQVRVDLLEHTVEWVRTHPVHTSIGKVPIPESMHNQDLYPVIEFSGYYTGAVTLL